MSSSENPVPKESVQADIQVTAELHAGLLPSPDTVERYERIQPGALDRLLTMAENDQQYKFEHNGRLLTIHEHDRRSDRFFAHCGQVFGFAVMVMFFAVLGVTAWTGSVTMFCGLLGAGVLTGLGRIIRSFQNRGDTTTSTDVEERQHNQ
jgi:uncharacterized membrane protein